MTGNIEEITVSDTGLGLSKEDAKKLFRIDVQHSTDGTAKEKGTGLGLILCKEFIERNGGKIWVESEFGIGSDFKFTLPKAKDVFADNVKARDTRIDEYQMKSDIRPECLQTNDLQGSADKDTEKKRASADIDNQKNEFPMRILLVDDDDDNHMIAKLFLKKLPIELDIAENGAIAVEKFKSGHYNLVIMDMQMPVMDGYAATREIRSFEKIKGEKETPVIALSAYSTKEEIQLSIDAGSNDHLSKPIRQGELIDMISRYTND